MNKSAKEKKNKSTKKAAKKITAKKSSTKKATTPKKATKLSKEKKTIKLSNTQRDKQLLKYIIEGMQEKKANNITVLDLQSIENSFCNYFVICEAESRPQLQAITESIEEFTNKKLSIKPHHTEGIQNAEWILIDYLTIVVHIFRSDIRSYYKIEELWADAKIQHI